MIILNFDLQPQFKCMNYFIYTSHHQRQRRLKNEFTFYRRISGYSKVIYFVITVKAITKLNLGHRNKFEKEFFKK